MNMLHLQFMLVEAFCPPKERKTFMSSCYDNTSPKDHMFIPFIHLGDAVLLIYLSERRKKEHLYDGNRHSHCHPIWAPHYLPLLPHIYVCVCVLPPSCLSRLLHAVFCRLEKVVVAPLKYHFNYRV